MSKSTGNRYHGFFVESLEGQEYLKTLQTLIDNDYKKAEEDPDHARDYVQNAKGVRQALNLAHAMSSEVKKT